ncbi:hypothetical protein QJS10_CPA06g02107 [Acorus calamus]|uniref:Uncharacterized protein n=1 Tax=Acorus calamus TaxID=4465 RepID=A0AAV9EM60_ACOCL|nr:hypothetical protein QJS10_CPA06g02107 [Acorus calamus]
MTSVLTWTVVSWTRKENRCPGFLGNVMYSWVARWDVGEGMESCMKQKFKLRNQMIDILPRMETQALKSNVESSGLQR